MTKDEIRARYSRIPTDFSQIQMLKDQLLESGVLDAAQKDPENAGKVLSINDEGEVALVSGGTKLYVHALVSNNASKGVTVVKGDVAVIQFATTDPAPDTMTTSSAALNGWSEFTDTVTEL